MPEAEPGQEQMMEPSEEKWTPHRDYAGESMQPGEFRDRPTADLGEDGELNSKLRSLNEGWGAGLIVGKERLGDLGARAADRIELLEQAMQEFCDRVDRGEVRSTRTYDKFKTLLGRTVPSGSGS